MVISGLYWRRSLLRAAQCPPGLLALGNGRVTFTTAEARVFDEPSSAVTGRLTGWGSLILTVAGAQYVLVESVGQLSVPFTTTQRQAISAATRSKSLRTLSEWPGALTAAGGRVSAPRFAYRRWLLGSVLLAVAAAAVVAIVLNGGL